jgi:hypothetical protein
VSDGRSPAQIEADIARRRQDLAATLDEIGVRMHPKTITDSAKASVREAVDHTVGRAYVAVNRAVSDLRSGLVTDEGAPRMERIVPVAVAAVAAVTAVVLVSRRSSRCKRR